LGINRDLGFTLAERRENIRRVAEIAKLFLHSGSVVFVSLISPLSADRAEAKAIIGADDFLEVYVQCPLEVCEQRDTKGLYAKARRGEIQHFTGIGSPYEPPHSPDLILSTATEGLEKSADELVAFIKKRIA
jgi:bifunctional enzyme CysN/CysC